MKVSLNVLLSSSERISRFSTSFERPGQERKVRNVVITIPMSNDAFFLIYFNLRGF